MKKRYLIMTILSVILLFSACTGNKEEAINSMSLDDIMSKVLENVENMPETESLKLVDEYYPSFLFIDYDEGYEALANEAMMSSVAHSVVILKLPEGSDVEKIRQDIEKNADPAKWVCVGAEKVEVVSKGNVIMLVMSFEDITNKLVENFNAIK